MDYNSIREKYGYFRHPIIEIQVGEVSLTAGEKRKKAIGVSNVSIDLSAGFEASQAVFRLYNVYDYDTTEFNFDSVKNFILLGSPITIYAGYDTTVMEVFRGVITKVGFFVEEDDVASIQVTAMDIKSIMMSNRYNKRLKAKYYSDAVKEIFDQNIYQSLIDKGAFSGISVDTTPDKGVGVAPAPGASENDTDKTIEMVGESDYEFVVKVAKKFNFDFFVANGKIYFRPAKSDLTKQITITPDANIRRMSVEYDMTGLVEEIVVRGLDVGKAKQVSVYIDPTVSDNSEAGYRANYLYENISYRYGSLELDIAGIPDIQPGKYIKISDLGTAASNEFYVQSVRHTFSADGAFMTHIEGKTDKQISGGLM